MSRQALDRAAGLLGFDELPSAPPRRLRVLWLENKLDCNTWSYYCDIRAAMAALHDLCSPSPRTTCLSDGFEPDVAVAGPRFTINIPTLATPCQKMAHGICENPAWPSRSRHVAREGSP